MKKCLYALLAGIVMAAAACTHTSHHDADTQKVLKHDSIHTALQQEPGITAPHQIKAVLPGTPAFEQLLKDIEKDQSDSIMAVFGKTSCLTDGYTAEDASMAAADLFEKHFQTTFNYLYAHHDTCFLHIMILGCSENLIGDGPESDQKALAKWRKDKETQAAKLGFDKTRTDTLNKWLQRIDPSMYD